jgi:hypothetical protein
VIDQIKKRLEDGFHPFAVRLTDGRRYEIPHRDFIAVHPKRIAVIDPEGLVISINPIHVVSVDDLAAVG